MRNFLTFILFPLICMTAGFIGERWVNPPAAPLVLKDSTIWVPYFLNAHEDACFFMAVRVYTYDTMILKPFSIPPYVTGPGELRKAMQPMVIEADTGGNWYTCVPCVFDPNAVKALLDQPKVTVYVRIGDTADLQLHGCLQCATDSTIIVGAKIGHDSTALIYSGHTWGATDSIIPHHKTRKHARI